MKKCKECKAELTDQKKELCSICDWNKPFNDLLDLID
jgi:RNA polymerase subunit RPABC4/transcription elongation factor Spt4